MSFYVKSHNLVKFDGQVGVVGIANLSWDHLVGVMFVDLQEVEETASKGLLKL